jgi:hypothetical protein
MPQQLLALEVTHAADQAGLQPLRAGLDLDALSGFTLAFTRCHSLSRISLFSAMKALPNQDIRGVECKPYRLSFGKYELPPGLRFPLFGEFALCHRDSISKN